MKSIVGKWLDYPKAVDYMIAHREERLQMEVEMILGQKFYVLFTL